MPTFKIINNIKDFDQAFPLLMQMYPNYSETKLKEMLTQMLPHNYQVLLYRQNNQLVGLTGFWLATKFWSGKYCEIDNFIIHPDYRNIGIGQKIIQKIIEISQKENCLMITLDAYTHNFKAHKFFYKEGFVAKGFHFVMDL